MDGAIEVRNLTKYYGDFEGNFVQNMRRLCQLCVKVRDICKIYGRADVAMNLQSVESTVLRGLVSVDSLYVNII